MQDLQNLLDALVAKERVSRSLQSGRRRWNLPVALRLDFTRSPGCSGGSGTRCSRCGLWHARPAIQADGSGNADANDFGDVVQSSVTNVHDMPNGEGLQFFNGFGGFDAEAREYVILHRERETLPAPWINVIANPEFGTHCSAEGGGYSWYGNSRERQITAWSSTVAVRDRPSEMFYIHDRDTGLLDIAHRAASWTKVRHLQDPTRFRLHHSRGQ